MHIYFSGIGGTGLGPLALIAKELGHEVSGSDKQNSAYIDYLKKHGISKIHIGQDRAAIQSVHRILPIDWFVYSSAVAIENPNAPELAFCKSQGIKMSKRDELLNKIITLTDMKLIAIAGTHGKTTTTAMMIWMFKQLGLPLSYSVGGKLSFADMGHYDGNSEYFVYEADEFDRNFLTFHPFLSLITGIDWDHPDTYPTRQNYVEAFDKFLGQSKHAIVWQPDAKQLDLKPNEDLAILNPDDKVLEKIQLAGLVNRQNAWQVIKAMRALTKQPLDTLINEANEFPGLPRRFEEIIPGLYSDYAHTPAKIRGALQTAHEKAGENVVVIYEGLHNTRQHFIKEDLKHLFDSVKKLYVVPSYLAREDANLPTLSPQDIVNLTSMPSKGQATGIDPELVHTIATHLKNGDLVLCLTAGGGGSLDEWLRANFY